MVKSKKKASGSGAARRASRRYHRGFATVVEKDRKRLKKQKEYRRQKLSKLKRKEIVSKLGGIGRVLFATLLLGLLVNMSRIKAYSFTGLTGLSDADKQVVSSLTDDYIGGLSSFKMFFNTEEYEQHILDNASFASSVEASYQLISTRLHVRVIPKSPTLIYDGTGAAQGSRWIAQDGTLISLTAEQLESLGSSAPTTVLIDNTGVNYQEGDQVVPVSLIDYMLKLTIALSLEDITVSDFEISEKPRQLIVDLAGEKYNLLVSTDRSIQTTVEDLVTVRDLLKSKKRLITKYVDLRVVDKVFYQ